jgi:uncharacterized protein with HEPN domain
MNVRDSDAIRHILHYCEQINETRKEFGDSKDKFIESATFHNAVCMCLLQIGELTNVLSDDIKLNNPDIQWRDIKLLRNIVVHRYNHVDYDTIWEICLTDIPVLIDFCSKILNV